MLLAPSEPPSIASHPSMPRHPPTARPLASVSCAPLRSRPRSGAPHQVPPRPRRSLRRLPAGPTSPRPRARAELRGPGGRRVDAAPGGRRFGAPFDRSKGPGVRVLFGSVAEGWSTPSIGFAEGRVIGQDTRTRGVELDSPEKR